MTYSDTETQTTFLGSDYFITIRKRISEKIIINNVIVVNGLSKPSPINGS